MLALLFMNLLFLHCFKKNTVTISVVAENVCRNMVAFVVNNIFAPHANLAQLVEHFIRNERVVGSIPIVGS